MIEYVFSPLEFPFLHLLSVERSQRSRLLGFSLSKVYVFFSFFDRSFYLFFISLPPLLISAVDSQPISDQERTRRAADSSSSVAGAFHPVAPVPSETSSSTSSSHPSSSSRSDAARRVCCFSSFYFFFFFFFISVCFSSLPFLFSVFSSWLVAGTETFADEA